MITRYRISLGGVHLDQVHPSIIIHDITESAPAMTIRTNDRPDGSGSYLGRKVRKSKTVQVSFEVHEKNPVERQKVLDAITAWCDSSDALQVNYREGKELYATCTAYPAAGAQKWAQSITARFVAYEVPFWQDVKAAGGSIEQKSLPGSNPMTFEALVNVGGTAETPLTVSVKNEGTSVVTSVNITAGVFGGATKTITLAGISLAGGQELLVTHDKSDRLQLRIGNESVYSKLLATSDDDLSIAPGMNFINVSTTPGKLKVDCSYRARWK